MDLSGCLTQLVVLHPLRIETKRLSKSAMEMQTWPSKNTCFECDSPQSVHSAIPFTYFGVLQSMHTSVALAGGVLSQAKQSDGISSLCSEKVDDDNTYDDEDNDEDEDDNDVELEIELDDKEDPVARLSASPLLCRRFLLTDVLARSPTPNPNRVPRTTCSASTTASNN